MTSEILHFPLGLCQKYSLKTGVNLDLKNILEKLTAKKYFPRCYIHQSNLEACGVKIEIYLLLSNSFNYLVMMFINTGLM